MRQRLYTIFIHCLESWQCFVAAYRDLCFQTRWLTQPVTAGSPMAAEWKFVDFFRITAGDEITLKKQLAQALDIRYGAVKQDKPFAHDVAGVSPYDVGKVQAALTKVRELREKVAGNPDNSQVAREFKQSCCMAVVVSGCLVNWSPVKPPNVGYIKHWAENKLPGWDATLERKAAGIDSSVQLESQHLSITSMSSLLALMAQTVLLFKQGRLTAPEHEFIRNAFCSLRVSLHLDLQTDELMLVNEAENIEQAERKRHNELDNIQLLVTWRASCHQVRWPL